MKLYIVSFEVLTTVMLLLTTTMQMDELCRLLTNVCTVVPNGVVCFVSSFGYLEQVNPIFQQHKLHTIAPFTACVYTHAYTPCALCLCSTVTTLLRVSAIALLRVLTSTYSLLHATARYFTLL
jgi:hypothetical protein